MSAAAEGAGAVEILVDADEAGSRLDALLAGHPRVGSRSAAERLIAAGRVRVNGEVAALKRRRLAPGERVEAELEAAVAPPPAPPAPHEVVFEDDVLIVVDKPPGVVVHPDAAHPDGTLVDALRPRAAGGADPTRPGIVHRLDRDTSGLLVVAKSDAAHAALSDLLRARAIERGYLALVEGRPDALAGTIDAPIGRDRDRRTVMSINTERPREARTHFKLLEPFARTSLLEAKLETGRTHQVRAHLAAIDLPVCGDPLYGGARSGTRLGLSRQFLHSTRLAFAHPTTSQPLSFSSPLPGDLASALARARAEEPD